MQRLREAHGIVLPLIAAVKVGTRNDAVRAFANDTQVYVNRHIAYLEGTGLVDYSALPETPSPGLLSGSANWTDLIVPGLVLIACLLVAVALGATLRGRSSARRAAAAAAPTRSAPRVATAKSLIALPEAPIRIREIPEDDTPTGSFPSVGSAIASGSSVGTSGGFPSTASRIAATGGFPSPRTPGRGVPYPDAVSPGVNDTGPRHAVRR